MTAYIFDFSLLFYRYAASFGVTGEIADELLRLQSQAGEPAASEQASNSVLRAETFRHPRDGRVIVEEGRKVNGKGG